MGGGAATTVTSAQATTISTTTTVAEVFAPVDVTIETGTDPCLLLDAFSQGGLDYVVVDYVQVKWTADGYDFQIINENRKLRTFIVPAGADISWWAGEQDPEELEAGLEYDPSFSFEGLTHIAGTNSADYTSNGFFTIQVSKGALAGAPQTRLIPGPASRPDPPAPPTARRRPRAPAPAPPTWRWQPSPGLSRWRRRTPTC